MMDMQTVCRICIYVSQHTCREQLLCLHMHIQEHHLAPSVFKGRYLYCILNCLLCVVHVLQVPLMWSLYCLHLSFCELLGGTAVQSVSCVLYWFVSLCQSSRYCVEESWYLTPHTLLKSHCAVYTSLPYLCASQG